MASGTQAASVGSADPQEDSDPENMRDPDRAKGSRWAVWSLTVSVWTGGMVGGMTMPLIPLFLVSRGFTIIELGWTITLISLSALAAHQVAYRLYHRLSRLRVLAWVSAIPGMMLPIYLSVTELWQIILIAATAASISAIAYPAAQARGATIAQAAGPTKIFAHFGMFTGFAFAAGVLLGATLLVSGWPAVFWTGAGLATLSAVVAHLAANRTRHQATPDEPAAKEEPGEGDLRTITHITADLHSSARSFATGLHVAHQRLQHHSDEATAIQERRVRALVVHAVFFSSAFTMFPFFIPLFFESYGISYAAAAAIMAAGWIVYAPAHLLAPRFERLMGHGASAAFFTILLMAIFIAIMGAGSFWVALTAWIILSVIDGMGRPIRNAIIMGSRRGAAGYLSLAWLDSSSHMARIVSPLLFATTIYLWGFTGGLAFASLMLMASTFPFLRIWSHAIDARKEGIPS